MEFKISGYTRLVGLLGYPVRHSLSPLMHNMAFQHLGLDYVYLVFEVKEDNLKEAVDAMKTLDVAGFNVTMPNKQKIIPLLDEISEEARLIGSVNTVVNKNGHLKGYNTDGKGYVMGLADEGISPEGKTIVIAGAGGASKSVAIQLALEGAKEITILNRTVEAAEEICNIINKNIPTCKTSATGYEDNELKQQLKEADLFINCTNLGMGSHEEKSIISSTDILHPDLIVSDVVYAPPKTKLLHMAEEVGCKTINGLGMIIGQGALAFKLWTGEDMPIEYIKRIILSK
ncbi:shikimate 5-dehydrogenase [Alkaliphilus metalliredigens QYMF]|uniref:Shikimate dehydrogenase (NADP(+)) n=1 Tax=Alkaliphilus metalliredigens (strain QYMF) TaxID=293826 RepID=AROE_ALKMQ|nr:shikimate dehydrogenase [Alkaliphilus metalliredigens]A6TM69.1 RecName: Full=Shikimate dehydrogenase (NADP(+)); Short=SDH [Alkaliphilus metalliredigens QYMF]ABR47287.1 shikimate 5-dehydrogenase [Alkaliphilus metalliredigens QYMF]